MEKKEGEIKEMLFTLAIQYAENKWELNDIRRSLNRLYDKYIYTKNPEDDYLCVESSGIIEDIYELNSRATRIRAEEGSEKYNFDSVMEGYNDTDFKASYEDLCECYKLYKRRKELKAFRGKVTRKLYLIGKQLSNLKEKGE